MKTFSEQVSIVCEQIEAAVAFADSEEDLPVGVAKVIEFSAKRQAFLKSKDSTNITTGKGRGGLGLTSTRQLSFISNPVDTILPNSAKS